MAQFEVYRNNNPGSRDQYPYLLDIQSDLLDDLRTTVVVPLMPASAAKAIRITRLNPLIQIDGSDHVVLVQDMAGIDKHSLGTVVCDLASYRAEIIAAVDFILSGI